MAFKPIQGIKGLLSDPSALMGLGENPLWTGGMGLLSSNYDPRINPFQALQGGFSGAMQQKQQQEDRQRIEELRKQLAALIAQQQGGGMPPGAMTPGVDSPSTMQPTSGGAGYVDQMLRENMWRNVIGGGGMGSRGYS